MKIVGVFRLCLAAALAMPTVVNAGQCDRSKRVYAFDQSNPGDDTKIFYKVRTGEHPFYAELIKFETWRKSKLVWSIDGVVICSDVLPMCNLDLPSSKKNSDKSVSYECFKEIDDPAAPNEPAVPFLIPVTEIFSGEQTPYIAFGNLTAFSLACSKHMGVHIKRKELLTEDERKNGFVLPPFVRLESCQE
ncbi:hypothetical protein [Rhizobium ruizarguesonis]|jgi:hypothetical protein|uniref:Uncharacterized protein n=1 Tax=Rhizobium ruizarguesonis TaxID=2081791 RepID=A0AAE8U565_9HYPH|nr:hypothetical protein [Rhizobium ruizarguesonis]MBY5897717.1 hypothetical protein [Rhizobium leguminosarum]TBY63258.1 hypothetical protein E0H46_26700 [Rhizobium leguminosarum bv. viciae]TAU05653.1 hypothetical protein ELI55_12690 [Rhizobium ruizarguesonis]TAW59246.1 hypothetical protein ELI17_24440 [Rhizobium ruizarguesonis]TAZ42878.1 hypothetical protein ELH74_27390 [Rhizobium ruizarguesonis]